MENLLKKQRFDMEFFLHILILIGIYSMLTMSLDLLVGQTGILSLCHAAFYCIGAYSSALLTVYGGVSFGSGLLIGFSTFSSS